MALSRKASKERTHKKLIKATLKVLLREGPADLTTGRIAEEAGVAQPTFYVHFADMDQALSEAADWVEERLNTNLREGRKNLKLGSPYETIRNAFQISVESMVKDSRLTSLFLRHRRDTSTPLGRRFRKMHERAREELLRDLKAIGMTNEMVPDLGVHAHLVVGMTLSMVEALIDKELQDPEACYDSLARMALGATAHWRAD